MTSKLRVSSPSIWFSATNPFSSRSWEHLEHLQEQSSVQSLPACRGVRRHQEQNVNGLHLYSTFLTSGNSKHPFSPIHAHIHTQRRSPPRKATASSSGAARVRCLAQGQLNTSNLPAKPLYLLSHMPPHKKLFVQLRGQQPL